MSSESRLPPAPPESAGESLLKSTAANTTDTAADNDSHLRIWALIPWVVNGRADAAAQAQVHRHCAQCRDCQREWRFQQQLYLAIQAQPLDAQAQTVATPSATATAAPSATPNAPPLDAQAGFARLLARIEAEAPPSPQALPVPPPAAAATVAAAPANQGVTAAPAAVSPPRSPATQRKLRRWKALAAAAVLAEALTLAWIGGRLSGPAATATDYRTLSQAPAAATAADHPAAIHLVAAPNLTLGALQTLLQQQNLHVVAGPSAAGVWSLAGAQALDAGELNRVLMALRAHPQVLLAEPTGDVPR